MQKILLFTFLFLGLAINPINAEEKNSTLSRYETAIELAVKLAELENNSSNFSQKQISELEQRCIESSDELEKLGINVSSLEKDMVSVKENIAELKSDVDSLNIKKDDRIKINGMYVIENINSRYENRLGLEPDEDASTHYTEIDVFMDATVKVSKDIEIFSKWCMVCDDFEGTNKNTDTIIDAELKLNNLFNSNGLLRIGRSYIRHGSGFVLNTNMDGINYSKKNGNTKVEYGMYFQKQINEAYHPIFNFYVEQKKNKRKNFFDLYYNSFEDGAYEVAYVDNVSERNVKNCSIWLLNIGSLGQFGKNKEFEYLVDGVVSYLHDDNQRERNQTGFAGHASIRYTPKKSDFSGLVAYNFYTYDCYEELGTTTRNNSWEDFANMSFNDKYWDYGHKVLIPNTQNWRFLVSYRPKRHLKHKLEFSYDYITGLNTNKPYGHISEEEAYEGLKVKDIMYGVEYSYKMSKTTDLVINYQKQKDKAFDGIYDSHDLVFSLISKF